LGTDVDQEPKPLVRRNKRRSNAASLRGGVRKVGEEALRTAIRGWGGLLKTGRGK